MSGDQNGDVSGPEMVSGRYTLLWQSEICASEDIRLAGEPSRQHKMFGAVRQIFHQLDAEVEFLCSRQGAKPACRSAFLIGLPVKSAFALLLTKVTKEGLRPDAARTTNV